VVEAEQAGPVTNGYAWSGTMRATGDVVETMIPAASTAALDVVHDIKKDYGGNLDHLVLAPNTAFAVETKSGRETAGARSQALAR